jgi:hypothetical protein
MAEALSSGAGGFVSLSNLIFVGIPTEAQPPTEQLLRSTVKQKPNASCVSESEHKKALSAADGLVSASVLCDDLTPTQKSHAHAQAHAHAHAQPAAMTWEGTAAESRARLAGVQDVVLLETTPGVCPKQSLSRVQAAWSQPTATSRSTAAGATDILADGAVPAVANHVDARSRTFFVARGPLAYAVDQIAREVAFLDPVKVSSLNVNPSGAELSQMLSGELPAALYERSGILAEGTRHVFEPTDFLETGLVDRLLQDVRGSIWLAPQQEAMLVSEPSGVVLGSRHSVPTQKELRTQMNKSTAGKALLRRMSRLPSMTSPMPSESLALQALLPSLRTGDLLLFQSEKFSAKFLQHALKAPYSHLAVVIIFPGLQAQPLLLEADPGTALMRNWSSATRAHLHLIDFCSRLLGWQAGRGNQAVIRRLEVANGMPQMHEDAVLQLLAQSTTIDSSVKLGSVEPVNQERHELAWCV